MKDRSVLSSVGFKLSRIQAVEKLIAAKPEEFPSRNAVVRTALDEFLIKRGLLKAEN